MSNTLYLTLTLILTGVGLVLSLGFIDGFVWDKKRYKIYLLSSVVLLTIGVINIPIAVQHWERQLKEVKSQLLTSGTPIITIYGGEYNFPVIHRKVIIKDGADFSYHELVKR